MKLSYLFLFAIGLTVVAPTHSGSLEPPPGSISGTRGPDTCFSQNGGKFVDCGDGTVKDRTTGLYWLKDATCLGLLNWEDGNLAIAQLGHGQCGLTDGSLPGDWRLPTLACPSGISCALSEATGEFATIFNPSCPAPYIQNVVGIGCGSEGDPFTGAVEGVYFSGSIRLTAPFGSGTAQAGLTSAGGGTVNQGALSNATYVWPVREAFKK